MGEKLTKAQREFLLSFAEEEIETEDEWLCCDGEDKRTARSLKRRGVVELYGDDGPGRYFDARLTTAGLALLAKEHQN